MSRDCSHSSSEGGKSLNGISAGAQQVAYKIKRLQKIEQKPFDKLRIKNVDFSVFDKIGANS